MVYRAKITRIREKVERRYDPKNYNYVKDERDVYVEVKSENEAELLEYANKMAERNDVTSFMYYMWNAWCKEECERAFSRTVNWEHFWRKWCGICDTYGVFSATERFYAELSDRSRNLLVARALEVYDKDCPKVLKDSEHEIS